MKKLFIYIILLSVTLALVTGCNKDKSEPPVLPDPESMTIDFSNFVSLAKSSGLEFGQKGTENSNWEFSATVVAAWKLLININLAVPVAAFRNTAGQNPVKLSKDNYQWSYSFTVANNTYKARLTSATGSTEVAWKMYISKEGTGGFTEFLWFEGTSKIDATSGQWILYENSQSQVKMLQIDWAKSGDSISGIKYTFIKDSDPFKNSYIEYGLTNTIYNKYFNIHYFTGLKFSDVNIEWNTTTKNGRVKCSDYLGDTEWHCWDTNKVNSKCQ